MLRQIKCHHIRHDQIGSNSKRHKQKIINQGRKREKTKAGWDIPNEIPSIDKQIGIILNLEDRIAIIIAC